MQRIFFILLFLYSSQLTIAQTSRAKGLVYNDTAYRKAVKKRDLDKRGPNLRELPIRVSLRPFCPTPQDQGDEPSCTAWAIAYGAFTIEDALRRKISRTDDVNKIATSKSFVYNQLTQNNADNIPSIETTLDFLQQKGACFAATFRNDVPLSQSPDSLALMEASLRRLLLVQEVYDPETSDNTRRLLQRFKRMLADSTPLVAGLRLPYSFSNCTTAVFRADKEEPLDSAAHAICLIGYDDVDSTFECMNSWGTAWGGDGGFVRVPYGEFFRYLCCAWRIKPQFALEKPVSVVQGAVVVRQSAGYDASRKPRFEELRMEYYPEQGYYQSRQPVWQAGTGFQLVLRETPPQWWTTVFNVNARGEVQVLHEEQARPDVIEPVIPGEHTLLEIEEEGVEWLFVLYSKAPPAPFRSTLEQAIRSSGQHPETAVQQYFKTLNTPAPFCHPWRMAFSYPRQQAPVQALLTLRIETR